MKKPKDDNPHSKALRKIYNLINVHSLGEYWEVEIWGDGQTEGRNAERIDISDTGDLNFSCHFDISHDGKISGEDLYIEDADGKIIATIANALNADPEKIGFEIIAEISDAIA